MHCNFSCRKTTVCTRNETKHCFVPPGTEDATCQCRPDIVLPTEWVNPPDVIFHPANRTRVAVIRPNTVSCKYARILEIDNWKTETVCGRGFVCSQPCNFQHQSFWNKVFVRNVFETNYFHFECDMDGRIPSILIGTNRQFWSMIQRCNFCFHRQTRIFRVAHSTMGTVCALLPSISCSRFETAHQMISLHRCPASWRCGILHICRLHVFLKQFENPQTFKKR